MSKRIDDMTEYHLPVHVGRTKLKLWRRVLYIANLACIGATIWMILVLAGSLQAVIGQ